MRKIVNHRITQTTCLVMSIILLVCFILAVVYIILENSYVFFLSGFILSIITSLFLIVALESLRKEKINNIRYFQKFNIIFFIIYLVSVLLLILSINEVYYNLNNNYFPQAIGMDQSAYLMKSAPLIFLSSYAIIVNIFSFLILFFILKKKINSNTNSNLSLH